MTGLTRTDRVVSIRRNGRRDASPNRPFEVQRVAARCMKPHLLSRGSMLTVAVARSSRPETRGVVARTAEGSQ